MTAIKSSSHQVPSKVLKNRFKAYWPEITLVLVTMMWGGTYSIIQAGLDGLRGTIGGPLFFVGARFILAALLTLALFWNRLRRPNRLELLGGVLAGLAGSLGQDFQTVGLETITASQSAFLTALYVPLVPVVEWLLMRKTPRPAVWVGLGLAFAGLVVLTGQGAALVGGGAVHLSTGDVLTLLSAVAVAFEIVIIGMVAGGGVNTFNVTVVQLFTCGVAALCAMPLNHEHWPGLSYEWLAPAMGLAIASTAIQFAMNWAQKYVTPSRAAVIYAGEPVWGGVFGRVSGDHTGWRAVWGALLIVAGVMASEWNFSRTLEKSLNLKNKLVQRKNPTANNMADGEKSVSDQAPSIAPHRDGAGSGP
ncbi:DMT family transporter [Formicincola oecophyllae]|uniref:DMT family transporter n=1 Tax=Formicincola oecophyllae TaxID=2558361 RepID=A0A4Y6U9Q8_9PROT|nr:DMT family transporter [Formicincola oecophyllae]QDH13298.1 DMT family transporter [Formicincola oecophyllae]